MIDDRFRRAPSRCGPRSYEQLRADITAGCADRLQQMDVPFGPGVVAENEVGFGDFPLGAFDEDSIMSYCRLDQRPRLTDDDVTQVNAAYEELAQKLPSSTNANDEEEEDQDEDDAPSEKKKKKSPVAGAPAPIGGCSGI